MEDKGKAANTLIILSSNNQTGNTVCECVLGGCLPKRLPARHA